MAEVANDSLKGSPPAKPAGESKLSDTKPTADDKIQVNEMMDPDDYDENGNLDELV